MDTPEMLESDRKAERDVTKRVLSTRTTIGSSG
jgi:hypothetical protein